ncbi:MAG: CRTAC1 family protein, partial [Planctomycetes bacterium]|nr:CRTAC1 family protein [Planctomycetota bacterium]
RAEGAQPEGPIWKALQALKHPAAALPPRERRRALAEELLGARHLPRFVDASDRLEVNAGRRIAFADVDLDGDPDLLLGGATLLLNDGTGRFTRARGCGLSGGGRGGVFADYDHDGDLDLFVAGGGPDRLYRNDSTPGKVRFADVTATVAEGLNDGHPSEGAAWGDLNGDGYPDLYVANYELDAQHIDTGTPDRLWLSDGRGGLRAAHDLIQQTPLLCGRGVSPCDVDQDGDLDLFVSNYRLQRDLLFVNAGGALHERARALGVAGVRQRGAYGHTIGAAWGDLDLDGDLDLVCANLAHPRFIAFSDPTFVYLQRRDGSFREARQELGIWFEETHSHPLLWDLDDDGDLDLTLTATYAGRPSTTYRNRRVEDGRLRFEDVTWGTSTRVFNGWGAACADVDLDGDLDAAVSAQGGVELWLNQGDGRGNRSVRVRLAGTRSDTWGAYARCTLTFGDGRSLVRQLTLGSGTTCQSEPILHLGVGQDPGPFLLTVRWPRGATSQVWLGPGLHTVREPSGLAPGAADPWAPSRAR